MAFFVVKNYSIICVPCVICPEGMGPVVECVCDVLHEGDVELECIPCQTGYFSLIEMELILLKNVKYV